MVISNKTVINKSKEIGFDLVGISKAENLQKETQHLQEWLQKNFHAGMKYMENNLDKRQDLTKILPEAKSVISLGLNYFLEGNYSNDPNYGKISRYAWGKDYHLILWEKCDKLIVYLKSIDPNFEGKAYVDTGPVMDKAWAVRAGLGWLGKHTNVINKNIGSWFFIANIITNYEFESSDIQSDLCGSCTRCIDACPTNAIVDEYVIDANKCISYLTIENKCEIADEFQDKLNNWVFGCDICQEVCPWNVKFAVRTEESEFIETKENIEMNLYEILKMSDSGFKERFKYSPIKRPKLRGLKRNAEFLLKSANPK